MTIFGLTKHDFTPTPIILVVLFCSALLPVIAEESRWKTMRERMIEEIKVDLVQARHYVGQSEFSPDVLDAIGKVERHEFVPAHLRQRSYGNYPLPIGDGQTISQPFIVALMTELLGIQSDAKVLEIGTGSGYQAAVLAEIAAEVYSIEIVASLATAAQSRLAALGYDNIHVRYGDGMQGWPGEAPFDGIIVTAAGLNIPDALLAQLAPGARLVMPVGAQDETQQLKVIIKNIDLSISERDVLPVRFVPITDTKR